MKLYHLTAVPPTSRTLMIQGSFSGSRQQELITASGSSLELYRLHAKTDHLTPEIRVDLFAQVRSLATFRLPGTKRDYLVVASDSGSLTVLSADAVSRIFRRVHCEPYGRSGTRRVVPGQYVACDPRGRACMLAAVERNKLCYVLNRDAKENLTISSALEASKAGFSTFNLIGLDVGFENPVFASLERSYDEGEARVLVLYELDLGLNHVVRRSAGTVRDTSFLMLPVPGSVDGPGGLLICSIGSVMYQSILANQASQSRLEVKLPHRHGCAEETMIVSGTVYHDAKRKAFFFLLCTEHGDLIKADLAWNLEKGPYQLRLVYFDTLPSAATSMSIFRSGFLAVALEGGNSMLLRFEAVDIPDTSEGYSAVELGGSSAELSVKTKPKRAAHSRGPETPKLCRGRSRLAFTAREKLANLMVVGVQESLAPLLSVLGTSDEEGNQAMIGTSGRGGCGTVRALRRGIAVLDVSTSFHFPAPVQAMYSVRVTSEERHHRYIVVSFLDGTRVLEVGSSRVQETFQTGFQLQAMTLCAGLMCDSSFVQVFADGVRYIANGLRKDASEWKPPHDSNIVAACCNRFQVLVILTSGILIYFEASPMSQELSETTRVGNLIDHTNVEAHSPLGDEAGSTAILAIPSLKPGRVRASIFALVAGASSRIRLFKVNADASINPLGLILAPGPVASLALVDFGMLAADLKNSYDRSSSMIHSPNQFEQLKLVAGTKDGAFMYARVESSTGVISNKRSSFLGMHPVRVLETYIAGCPVCLCMGTQSRLLHMRGGRLTVSPLCSEKMDQACAFSSERSPDGFAATYGRSFRLLVFEATDSMTSAARIPVATSAVSIPSSISLKSLFHVSETRLNSTPRKIVPLRTDPSVHPEPSNRSSENDPKPSRLFLVLESDRREQWENLPHTTRNRVSVREKERESRDLDPRPAAAWYSRLQLVSLKSRSEAEEGPLDAYDPLVTGAPEALSVHDSVCFSNSYETMSDVTSSAALACPGVQHHALSFVVVSCVSRNTSKADSDELDGSGTLPAGEERVSGSVMVYEVNRDTRKLNFLHRTPTPEPPFIVESFRDMLLVAMGNSLRLYILGKRRLLKRVEYKLAVPNRISALSVAGGDRLFVADVQHSVTVLHFVLLKNDTCNYEASPPDRGRFLRIASDAVPRWVVSLHCIDYNTVCGSDKFGNLFVLRYSANSSPTLTSPGSLAGWNEGYLTSSTMSVQGLELQASFHVGSLVVGMTAASLNGQNWAAGCVPDSKPGSCAVVYCTVEGAIGMLMPLVSPSDASFAESLERQLRTMRLSLCGRDHVSYRSSYCPLKNVIDGDLCEMYATLSPENQRKCSSTLALSVDDVYSKLDDLRSLVL